MNPDKLRRNQDVLNFVKSFFEEGKPVAAICHGPWTLIDAGVAKGRKMTSARDDRDGPEKCRRELGESRSGGGQRLVTSRKPDDLPAFNRKMIEEFREGICMAVKKAARTSPRARSLVTQKL